MLFYQSFDGASYARQKNALLRAMTSIPDRLDDGKEPAVVLIYKSQEKRELGAEFDYAKQIQPDFVQAAVFDILHSPIFLFCLEQFYEEILHHSKLVITSTQASGKRQCQKQNYYWCEIILQIKRQYFVLASKVTEMELINQTTSQTRRKIRGYIHTASVVPELSHGLHHQIFFVS